MSRSFQKFIFHSYHFDEASKTLKLHYRFDDELSFTETFTFDFPFVQHDKAVLDQAFQALFFMAGVSYYKAYASQEIVVNQGKLSQKDAAFFAETYQKGLGEYFYVNRLDPRTEIPFVPTTATDNKTHAVNNDGLLIGIGGGKDSLVSVELLRNQPKVATWSVGHRKQLEPLIKTIGLPHFWVDRAIDPLIIELGKQDARSGHIPISAILGCVGTIVAVLTGYRDALVSNEHSANEPTLTYDGVEINHQYSKSLAYETNYQAYLARHFGEGLRYYSFLRPFSELKIAELFSVLGFAKYQDVFSSCNRAFVHTSTSMSWCGVCSKCAFVFLALSPFIERQTLEKLWRKNLLLDPTLVITYENLLGISGEKPLDCVGEIKESRTAMRLTQGLYPGLNYEYDIPSDYSYKDRAAHSMPTEIYEVLENV